jgi:hypothetical protein
VQPLEFICNMGADGLTPGDAIPPPRDRRALDAQNPRWHAITGPVVREVVYNPATPLYFFVKPAVPTSPAVWIMLAWIVKPPVLVGGAPGAEIYAWSGSNATTIDVDDLHVDDLIDYIVARARMKASNFAENDPVAAQHTARFLGSLNLRVQALTGNNPNLKRLPFAPEPIGAAK